MRIDSVQGVDLLRTMNVRVEFYFYLGLENLLLLWFVQLFPWKYFYLQRFKEFLQGPVCPVDNDSILTNNIYWLLENIDV